jgi:hypothetical protein
MKIELKKTLLLFFFAVILFSCNKENRFSKKLIKGETWTVESVKLDGTSLNSGSKWLVKGDDIYETVSQVSWSASATNEASFEWQFQDKGKSWVLNYLCNCDEADGTLLDELDFLANDISGKYEVIKHKRKEMIFRSSETKKYKGKVLEIKVIRD